MNNVFVMFSSFVYDGCVSYTDLHKHCQSWDVTLSTKVAEYKQHSCFNLYFLNIEDVDKMSQQENATKETISRGNFD